MKLVLRANRMYRRGNNYHQPSPIDNGVYVLVRVMCDAYAVKAESRGELIRYTHKTNTQIEDGPLKLTKGEQTDSNQRCY